MVEAIKIWLIFNAALLAWLLWWRIRMTPVKSSNIEAIGFKDGVLSVKFKSGKQIYDYPNVTPDEHKAFVEADSIGSHFHNHIKGREFSKRDA